MKFLCILALSFLPAVVSYQAIVVNPCLCFNNGMCYGPNSENGCRTYFNSSTCVSAAVEQRCLDGEVFDVLSCGCASSDAAVCSSECHRPHGVVPISSTTATTPTPSTTSPIPTTTASSECPDGWVENPYKKCYKFVIDQKLNWEDANETCQAMDSLLATSGFSAEIKWVRDYRANHSDLQDRMWLGGVKRYDFWFWVMGANEVPIRVTDWSYGEPTRHQGENCLQLLKGRVHGFDFFTNSYNRWNDVSCSETMNFICQQGAASTRITTTPTTTTPTPRDSEYDPEATTPAGPRFCADGWVESPTKCYKFVTAPEYSWNSAKYQCRSVSSYLASPRTTAEVEWIRNFRESNSTLQGRTWIGGYDKEDVWTWADAIDSPLDWLDWAPGEPSYSWHRTYEGCMNLFEGSSLRSNPEMINRWNDAPCGDKMGYICQKEPKRGVI